MGGKPLIVDLANPNTCHGLIAGTSGSGKSELLKAIVASLIAANDVTSLRLGIVDPKILTFTGVNGSPYLAQPVIIDVQAAIALLKVAVEEMDRRYQRLAADGQTSLRDPLGCGRHLNSSEVETTRFPIFTSVTSTNYCLNCGASGAQVPPRGS